MREREREKYTNIQVGSPCLHHPNDYAFKGVNDRFSVGPFVFISFLFISSFPPPPHLTHQTIHHTGEMLFLQEMLALKTLHY